MADEKRITLFQAAKGVRKFAEQSLFPVMTDMPGLRIFISAALKHVENNPSMMVTLLGTIPMANVLMDYQPNDGTITVDGFLDCLADEVNSTPLKLNFKIPEFLGTSEVNLKFSKDDVQALRKVLSET